MSSITDVLLNIASAARLFHTSDGTPFVDLFASQLARHLGISRAAVARWWDKRKPASPHRRFIQVSDLLNVRVEWLVTGRGEALRTNHPTFLGKRSEQMQDERVYVRPKLCH